MALTEQQSHKLKQDIIAGKVQYEQALYDYLKIGEEVRTTAYTDTRGKVTIGIGYNMTDNGDKVWKKAFAHLGDKAPSFQLAFEGKISLTYEQIDMLYRATIEDHRNTIKGLYGDAWHISTATEKFALEDIWYNGKKGLIGRKTNFCPNFKSYAQMKDKGDMELAKLYLDVCLWEIRYNSNDPTKAQKDWNGLEARRKSEAVILNTYDAVITEERDAKAIKKEIEALLEKRNGSQNVAAGGAIVEGFVQNLQTFLTKQFGGREVVSTADINSIKAHVQQYMDAPGDGEYILHKVSAIVLEAVSKLQVPEAIIKAVREFLFMGLRYCTMAKQMR